MKVTANYDSQKKGTGSTLNNREATYLTIATFARTGRELALATPPNRIVF